MTKAILITGGAARIGAYLSKGLAADGYQVAIHYNSSKKTPQNLVQDIQSEGRKAVCVQADLTNASDVETLISRAAKAIGCPLTALINNASTYAPDKADKFSASDFDNHMDVNLKAPIVLAKTFTAALPEHESGTIINMIDQRVLRPRPDFFTYSLSKAALLTATKTMAQSFAPRVRVCGIGPGPTIQSVHQSDEEFNAEVQNTLLGNGSPPETILHAARYLLSAKAVTGQMIAVDGGQHLGFR
ncbi:MAG: SDR family oxidoreductase [Robiginitomaculum sp.]